MASDWYVRSLAARVAWHANFKQLALFTLIISFLGVCGCAPKVKSTTEAEIGPTQRDLALHFNPEVTTMIGTWTRIGDGSVLWLGVNRDRESVAGFWKAKRAKVTGEMNEFEGSYGTWQVEPDGKTVTVSVSGDAGALKMSLAWVEGLYSEILAPAPARDPALPGCYVRATIYKKSNSESP